MTKGKDKRVVGVLLKYGLPSLLFACLLAWGITFLMHLQSNKIVAQWKQPAEIEYDGRGPYYVTIIERDRNWRYVLETMRNYSIYVGRESEDPCYGHWINYPFPSDPKTIQSYLSNATVEWTNEGMTLELSSGHRIFVPKKQYTGGR